MPRLPKSFMVPKPLEPLNLEEIKFWLEIMEEHALFIKAGLPNEEQELIAEAQGFYQQFKDLRLRAERVQNDRKFNELVEASRDGATDFYRYIRRLLHLMLTCRLGGHNFPLFLDHVSRETEYFLRLLDVMGDGGKVLSGSAKAREDMFWLRIMADHAKFICHLLDPSEANFIAMAQDFSEEFDTLFLQSLDLASMQAHYEEVMAFRRFLQNVRAAVLRMRDFNKAAHDLIEECKLVGLIPAVMADHMRREAEHFLMVLSMLDKGILKSCPVVMEEEPEMFEEVTAGVQDIWEEPPAAKCVEEDIWGDERESEAEEMIAKAAAVKETAEIKSVPKFILPEDREEEEDTTEEDPIPEPQINKPEPPKKEPVKQEKIETKKKSSKYSWSDKWPRPLGR